MAAAHWGSRERAEEAANRRRDARAAQLRGAMADAWAGPGASLEELTNVALAGLDARRAAAAGSAGRETSTQLTDTIQEIAVDYKLLQMAVSPEHAEN